VVDFWNLSCSVSDSGHTIDNLSSPTLLYNDNDGCVKWLHNMTSKTARHIELCENSICEWVQDKTLTVVHVAGKVNPANIFTKEMKDGAHSRHLRDSFMIRLSDFVNDSLLDLYHVCQRSPNNVTPAAACSYCSHCQWVHLLHGCPCIHFLLLHPVKRFPPLQCRQISLSKASSPDSFRSPLVGPLPMLWVVLLLFSVRAYPWGP
jgi:hypothetical protein